MKFPITLGLVGLLIAAVVFTPKSSISQLPPSTVSPSSAPTISPTPTQANLPKRLTITVSVS